MGVNDLVLRGLDATSPAMDLVPIVPNDSTDLARTARAIRCQPTGTAGTLRYVSFAGEIRNTSIDVGESLPVIAIRVHSTGTTATGLEAMI